MAVGAATNRTTTAIKTTTTTRAPSTVSGGGGGSQSYLAVAIALPLTLAAVVIAMGLLRWKMRSAAVRRSSTYLDRRCQKNSKAPPPYADAQQLASAPPSVAVVAVGRKLSSRLSATLPRLPRAPDVRRLPPGFWTVGRALSNGSSGSGGLTASTSLPCLCPDEEVTVTDLRPQAAATPPAGGSDGSSSNSQEATSAKIVAAAAVLSPGPSPTAADDRQPHQQPPSPLAASAASLGVGARDDGSTALRADEGDGGPITARAWLAASSIERIDEEQDEDVAASNDDVIGERSLTAMGPIGARYFPLCISMPEISAAAAAAADDREDDDDERRPAEAGSDGEPAFTLRNSSRRRNSDAVASSVADTSADANSPAVRSPLGLAFRSTPIFMDDLGFEPTS